MQLWICLCAKKYSFTVSGAYVVQPFGQAVRIPNSKDNYVLNEERFANIRGMRNILRAIDGCHIAIKAPVHEPSAYVNWKRFHSVVLQTVVDSQLMFMDCYAGWPGSVHDASVFRNSPLYSFVRKFVHPICLY